MHSFSKGQVQKNRGKALGLLQLLLLIDATWQRIAMESIQGANRTWTIVSNFNRQAHFLPVKENIKAKNMAKLFISQVFKHHGMPISII